MRAAVALALTALVLAVQIPHWRHTKSGWLFTDGWYGWLPVALDVFFYAYFCWLAFWLIRGTKGPERLFMVGWFAGILLSPVETLRPQWAVAVKHIGALGLLDWQLRFSQRYLFCCAPRTPTLPALVLRRG